MIYCYDLSDAREFVNSLFIQGIMSLDLFHTYREREGEIYTTPAPDPLTRPPSHHETEEHLVSHHR
jgi:hypothetical protein